MPGVPPLLLSNRSRTTISRSCPGFLMYWNCRVLRSVPQWWAQISACGPVIWIQPYILTPSQERRKERREKSGLAILKSKAKVETRKPKGSSASFSGMWCTHLRYRSWISPSLIPIYTYSYHNNYNNVAFTPANTGRNSSCSVGYYLYRFYMYYQFISSLCKYKYLNQIMQYISMYIYNNRNIMNTQRLNLNSAFYSQKPFSCTHFASFFTLKIGPGEPTQKPDPNYKCTNRSYNSEIRYRVLALHQLTSSRRRCLLLARPSATSKIARIQSRSIFQ